MNIFVLDLNPQRAAVYHCDKHVVKMITETTQILSSVHHRTEKKDYIDYNFLYKDVKRGNQANIKWCLESIENYLWLCELGKQLCIEYRKRYKKIHKTEGKIDYLKNWLPHFNNTKLTFFAQCMPEQYKVKTGKLEDAVEAYRNYYVGEKSEFAKWKLGNIPEWYRIKLMEKRNSEDFDFIINL